VITPLMDARFDCPKAAEVAQIRKDMKTAVFRDMRPSKSSLVNIEYQIAGIANRKW
jgi:hypothetical protein